MSRPRVKVPGTGETAQEQLHGALSAIGQVSRGKLQSLLPFLSRFELGLQREFAPKFQALQERLIEQDPLRRGLREQALRALSEVPAGLGELPQDIERDLREATRTELASRGIDLRGAGAVTEETIRALGGRTRFSEALRSRRLAEAASFLGLSASPGATTPFSAATVLPSVPSLIGSSLQGQQLGLQASLANAQLELQRQMAIGQGIATIAGGAFGAAAGGGFFGAPAGKTPIGAGPGFLQGIGFDSSSFFD